MDKVIVFKNSNEGVSIIHPAPEMFDPESRTRINLAEKGVEFSDDDQVMQYIVENDVPKDAIYYIIDKNDLPDRDFRNAWDINGDKLHVNINRAREIKKDELRALRQPILQKLDVAALRAMEESNNAKFEEIKQQKQALRAVTDGVDSLNTIDQLNNYKPNILESL